MNDNVLTGVLAGLGMVMPKKEEKRDIKYAPAPKHLVAAIRKQLREMIDGPELEQRLGEIGRFATQADDMLMMVKAPEAVMKSEHAVGVPMAASSPIAAGPESYGANIIRQLMSGLTQYQQTQRDSPESLVYALSIARRQGMTDVCAELEKKLTGKVLDGKRPVDGKVDLSTYGITPAPVLAMSPPVAPKKQSKKNGAQT